MMSDPCREMRALLGPAALDRLEPSEEIALRAHLDGCAECRAELRELTSVARALPLAERSRIDTRVEPSKALGERVLSRVAHERSTMNTRRRRRFLLATTSAAAVIAALVALALTVPASGPAGTRVVFATTQGVEARATLHARAVGTEVAFHVSGLHDGEYYWLWLTADDGERVAAGTFRGTASTVDVVMTAAVPLSNTRRIWVTDARDRVVIDQFLPSRS